MINIRASSSERAKRRYGSDARRRQRHRNGNTVTFSIPTTELESYAGYAKLTYKTAVKRGGLDTSTNEVKFTNKASAESKQEVRIRQWHRHHQEQRYQKRLVNRSVVATALSTPFLLTSLPVYKKRHRLP